MYDEMTALHELANIENIFISYGTAGLPDELATLLIVMEVGEELGYGGDDD